MVSINIIEYKIFVTVNKLQIIKIKIATIYTIELNITV